jgi:hypothetical protein
LARSSTVLNDFPSPPHAADADISGPQTDQRAAVASFRAASRFA